MFFSLLLIASIGFHFSECKTKSFSGKVQGKSNCKACKRNAGAKDRGSDLFFATQYDPIRTRAELGAAFVVFYNPQAFPQHY